MLGDLTIVKALVPPKDLVIIQQVVNKENVCFVAKSYGTERLMRFEKSNSIDLLGNEIRCLTTLSDCPWVINLEGVWKTDDSIHLILEHCAGGDLLDYLFMFKPADIPTTKFYMSEIITALEVLHERLIMHGDLKPDNVFIGTDGHIKLGDFGMASMMKHKFARTIAKRGTLQYWSPLQHRKMPYGIKNDIWALGCIFFMLLTGNTPFPTNNVHNRKQVCQDAPIPEIAKDLLTQMWTVHECERIDLCDIKHHPFFEGVDWNNVGIEDPPWIPNEEDRQQLYEDVPYETFDLLSNDQSDQPLDYLNWINNRRSLSGEILPFQLNLLEEKLNATNGSETTDSEDMDSIRCC